MMPFTPSPYLTEKPIDNKNVADARMRSVSGADQAPGRWMKPQTAKKWVKSRENGISLTFCLANGSNAAPYYLLVHPYLALKVFL